jgi:alanyl-tRNA synthetase
MEYNKDESGNYIKLSQNNVDTGIGFERLAAILQEKDSAYETDIFLPIIKEIEELSNKKYELDKRFRIIADHIRGAVFLASEGILPSNTDRGYILRRLIRRIIRTSKLINLSGNYLIRLAEKVIESYQKVYPEILLNKDNILTILKEEEEKFKKTLDYGLKHFEKIVQKGSISGSDAFHLFETYGFPLELTEELAREKKIKIDKQEGEESKLSSSPSAIAREFKESFKKHQEISRAGAEKKFGGIGKGADNYEAVKLHTATHLLHTALRRILGEHVKQMGSDITWQRLRLDFSHSRKLTEGEIKKIEDLVNQKIKEDLELKKEEMSYENALKSGALAFFRERYPERVTVYSIGTAENIFSREICAGPHVKKTSELGIFKIIKEESSGAGVRRIRAVLKGSDLN